MTDVAICWVLCWAWTASNFCVAGATIFFKVYGFCVGNGCAGPYLIQTVGAQLAVVLSARKQGGHRRQTFTC